MGQIRVESLWLLLNISGTESKVRISNFEFHWSLSGELHTDFDENKIKHSIISDLVVLNSKGLNNINSNTVQSSNKIPKGSGPSSSGVVSLK